MFLFALCCVVYTWDMHLRRVAADNQMSLAAARWNFTEEKKAPSPTPIAKAAPAPAPVAAKPEAKDGLGRPEAVQGVFDRFQKAAVSMYKDLAGDQDKDTTAASASAAGAAASASSAAELEASLEALLTKSNMSPKKLPGSSKDELVNALEALEAAYKSPGADKERQLLAGTWSLVYTSSTKTFRAALGNVRSRLFKLSQPSQTIDAKAGSVTNRAMLRLRVSPVRHAVSQEGTFKAAGDSTYKVEFKRAAFGGRRFLAFFRKGATEAKVTYVSEKWRICRAGGCMVAFRKD